MLLNRVPLAQLTIRVIAEGSSGDAPLPSSLTWLPAMSRSSWVVALSSLSYSMAVAWRPPSAHCHVGRSTGYLLRGSWPPQSDGQCRRESLRGKPQSICNPVSELPSHHFCVFHSLQVSHWVPPTHRGKD